MMHFHKIIRIAEQPARADESALGTINRPLRMCFCSKHMQCSRHTQEATKIGDLGLQSWKHLGRELVKWFHHHVQVAALACTLPCPHDTTIYHHGGMDDPPASINVFGVWGRYREIALPVAKQIAVETWQQANDGGMDG